MVTNNAQEWLKEHYLTQPWFGWNTRGADNPQRVIKLALFCDKDGITREDCSQFYLDSDYLKWIDGQELELEGKLDLQGLPNLKHLYLQEQKITDLKLGDNNQLQSLKIDKCPQLRNLPTQKLTNLTYLEIIGEEDEPWEIDISPLTKLTYFRLKGNVKVLNVFGSWKEELTQQKTLHQNHLAKEKTQLKKEIQLIKEAFQ